MIVILVDTKGRARPDTHDPVRESLYARVRELEAENADYARSNALFRRLLDSVGTQVTIGEFVPVTFAEPAR